MTQGEDRVAAFEARLAALKARTEAGLSSRADALEAALERWSEGTSDEVRRIAHKFRGVAVDHPHLGELAASVETAAREGLWPEDGAELVSEARAIAARATESRSEAAKPPAPEKRPVPDPKAGAAAKRILVVDDDAAILRMVHVALERLGGFTVVAASDEPTACEALDGEPFALVVLDAMLPRTNGFELCR